MENQTHRHTTGATFLCGLVALGSCAPAGSADGSSDAGMGPGVDGALVTDAADLVADASRMDDARRIDAAAPDAQTPDAAPPEIVLDPMPGTYRRACDGSYGVAFDATHFISGSDEHQDVHLYTRGASANPVFTTDLSGALGLATGDEADLEDAARVGDRIYVTGSHGRTKNGVLDRARYRFFAMDVSGSGTGLTLHVVGYATTLLDRLLIASSWTTPDTAVIATLAAASLLAVDTDADLAPKSHGTNIEGLTWAPTAARPAQLLLGFRNPLQGTRAIVVSLLNPDAVVGGASPVFGEASLLDLGGLGVRAMAWSPVHHAVLVLAGPRDAGGPFALYRWSGVAGESATLVQAITGGPPDGSPESLVVYPHTHDVQILFDQDGQQIGGQDCSDASVSSRFFNDVIVHVP